ncbi:cytochrome P450 [Gorgonomyces haynaldii]|nr:cytochrome P450 [Gorgonomyces haynaldii]
MIPLAQVLITLFVLVGSHLLWRWISAQYLRRKNEPPLISGLPLIGMGIEYQKGGWALLKKSQQQYGDIFTFYMAGKRFHYVMDPITFSEYFKERQTLDFHEFVATFMHNVFGIHPQQLDTIDQVLQRQYHKLLSGKALQDLKKAFDDRLDIELAKMDQAEWKEDNLVEFTRRLFFKTSVDTIFGTDLLKDGFEEFLKDYFIFDRDLLQLASGVMPAKESKAAMHRCINKMEQFLDSQASTIVSERKKGFDEVKFNSHLIAAFQFGLLFGSQSNTLMASFWTLAHILSNPEVLKRVQAETGKETTPYLDACFQEALRLSSSTNGIRLCKNDFSLRIASLDKNFNIRKGDVVMAVGEAAHRDPELYTNPDVFDPNRFLETKPATKNGQPVLLSFMPFGKGVTMCPGRFFARTEVLSLVTKLVEKYEFQVLDPVPRPDPLRFGLGIMVPETIMRFRYRNKQ